MVGGDAGGQSVRVKKWNFNFRNMLVITERWSEDIPKVNLLFAPPSELSRRWMLAEGERRRWVPSSTTLPRYPSTSRYSPPPTVYLLFCCNIICISQAIMRPIGRFDCVFGRRRGRRKTGGSSPPLGYPRSATEQPFRRWLNTVPFCGPGTGTNECSPSRSFLLPPAAAAVVACRRNTLIMKMWNIRLIYKFGINLSSLDGCPAVGVGRVSGTIISSTLWILKFAQCSSAVPYTAVHEEL